MWNPGQHLQMSDLPIMLKATLLNGKLTKLPQSIGASSFCRCFLSWFIYPKRGMICGFYRDVISDACQDIPMHPAGAFRKWV